MFRGMTSKFRMGRVVRAVGGFTDGQAWAMPDPAVVATVVLSEAAKLASC